VVTLGLALYADFGSPACYVASSRADALIAAGVPVDWRAVETDPHLPVGGRGMSAAEQESLRHDLESLERLLLPEETLPAAPAFRPNTRGAVAAYAEAYAAGVADDVRRLLFDAYWTRGADIGSAEVLRRLLAGPILRGRSTGAPMSALDSVVSASRGPITTDAWRRIRDWSERRQRLGARPLPVLVVDGWQPVSGETALRRLEKEMLRVVAPPAPVLPDPGRFPAVDDPPHFSWLSEVGGRWRHAWKATL
jgi:2-hydroxychromene-2-carboxylate isomerase